MNVHASDWTAYEKSRPGCNEYQPSHQGATLLDAELGPTYAPNKSADYPDQDAHSERIIMMLNEVVAEVDCVVDLESGNAQNDQEAPESAISRHHRGVEILGLIQQSYKKLTLIDAFPEKRGYR